MKMASLVLHLLHLLLIISTASAWSCYGWQCSYYSFFGGSVTFTTKGQNSDGTYEVELRNKHSTRHCWHNDFVCYYGNCGYRNYYYSVYIDSNYIYHRGFYSCQSEVVSQLKLNSNLPFAIRFPKHNTYSRDRWTSNVRSSYAYWRMMAHVDLGTRSDTGESNRSPITAMVAVLRVNRNCPRSFNLTMFDPDGDRVRCRVPSSSQTHECGLCGMVSGFSLDQNSCTLHYVYSSSTGHHPIELVLEDFPKNHITLSYSTGHYTSKYPLSSGRYKRQATVVTSNTIAIPTITTTGPTTTATEPTTTTAVPTVTTTGPTITATGLTTTTTRQMTNTTGPTTTTAVPTNITAGPTTITTGQTVTTTGPTTITAGPTTITTGQTTTTAASTTTATSTTTTAASTTTTAGPATTTAAPTTTTAGPTTTTAASTTTTAGPTTTTAGPTTTTGPNLYLSSTAPLSKIPLQFTVYVESSYAPSCIDGDYFPVFLPPTPANGEHVPAFVNQTLEIKVIATAQYSTIKNLIISGPSGIRKRRISTEGYVIKWKPTENELNDHFLICFVSEAINRYNSYYVYQSELRCVIVDVGRYEASVTCNETTITVEVEKTYHIRQNEDSLHLNEYTNPSCNLTTRSNRTHLVAVMSLNDCGTLIEEDEHNITFKNVIKSTDREQIISRQNDIEIAFSCAYPKKTNVTLGFTHKNPYAFVEKGFGAFTFQFEFFNSQRFQTQKSADTYPVEVYLKQMIFMQIEATTSINTELFVESCKATPYDNPNSRISYTIIEHGCVRDNTVQIYPSSKSQFRFGMQAFEFIGAHDEVYITCSVILCEIGIPGTRCSQGCITSNAGNHRSKREAVAQSSTHSISQGPLHLVKTGKDFGSSLNLGMNIMFIVGCLLVCAVVIYRAKRPKATYQRLPTSETD